MDLARLPKSLIGAESYIYTISSKEGEIPWFTFLAISESIPSYCLIIPYMFNAVITLS